MFIPYGDNIERQTMPVVPVMLIVANVLVFAYQIRIVTDPACGNPEYAFMTFLKTWSLIPADLAQGQAVGLLTHMFLHGDASHILGNMLFLWTFACSLEVSLGRWTFLGFYLLFGVAGGLVHALSNMSNELPMLGASGAVAGLIGAYTVAYGPMSKIKTFIFLGFRPILISIPAWVFGAGWFCLQLLMAEFDSEAQGGVAWFAHIGGFMTGVVTMLICRHDTDGELQDCGDGYLTLVKTASPGSPEIEPDQGDVQLVLPETCPHCDQPMEEKDRISEQLARCGNALCGRMISLDAVTEPCVS